LNTQKNSKTRGTNVPTPAPPHAYATPYGWDEARLEKLQALLNDAASYGMELDEEDEDAAEAEASMAESEDPSESDFLAFADAEEYGDAAPAPAASAEERQRQRLEAMERARDEPAAAPVELEFELPVRAERVLLSNESESESAGAGAEAEAEEDGFYVEEETLPGVGLYKLRMQLAHSSKAAWFQPTLEAYKVKTRFQSLLFRILQLVPLHRGRRRRGGTAGARPPHALVQP
jgi:hypothetical protein